MFFSDEDRSVTRRWGKTVVSILLIGGLATAGYVWHLRTNPSLGFRSLTVVNADGIQVTTRQVGEAVEKSVNGNFFTTDLSRVREAVEVLPWVESATVRRVFPDRLVVEVTRRRAIALYEDGRLVSDRGVLFAANPDESGETDLPVFYGPAAQVALMTSAYERLKDVLSPLGADVTDFQISDRASWSLVFSSGTIPPTKVELGRDDEGIESVAKRLKAFVKAYPTVCQRLGGPPASVDLRYAKAFAAAWPDQKLLEAWRLKNTPDSARPAEPTTDETSAAASE